MSDSRSTNLRTSRSLPTSESTAARDARALLDASDAGATRGAPSRLDAVQSALKHVWGAVNDQQAEIEALREHLTETRDGAEHALAEQKAAERAAADREAELSADVRDKAEEIRFLGSQLALAAAEIQRLRDALRAAKGDAARTVQRGARVETAQRASHTLPSPEPLAAPSAPSRPLVDVPVEKHREVRQPDPPAPPAEESATLEALYRTFCREAGGLNSNPELFATSLRRAFPTAEVRTVYRDADSPARPIVLSAERRGNSAVPFWAVSVDGQHGLVPQPMGADQFRELAPCFTGQAAPASLAEIDPAPLTTFGAGFELTRPGRVA